MIILDVHVYVGGGTKRGRWGCPPKPWPLIKLIWWCPQNKETLPLAKNIACIVSIYYSLVPSIPTIVSWVIKHPWGCLNKTHNFRSHEYSCMDDIWYFLFALAIIPQSYITIKSCVIMYTNFLSTSQVHWGQGELVKQHKTWCNRWLLVETQLYVMPLLTCRSADYNIMVTTQPWHIVRFST